MIYFIVNTSSRTGKAAGIWRRVRDTLVSKDVKFKAYRTESKGHATDIARAIMKSDDKNIRIVILGGDGTINEVINGIDDFSRVTFGVIPTGSGNDFARGVGIDADIESNIEKIIAGTGVRTIDLGRVIYNNGENNRVFAISSGLGLDAIVCKKALISKLKKILNKLHLGQLTYIILTVQTLFTMKTGHIEIQIDDEQSEYGKMIFMAAMNLRAEGGGVPMAPQASPYDDVLSMCLAHDISRIGAFLRFPFLVAGKHEQFKCFDIRSFNKCSITLDRPMILHTDGEYCDDVTSVEYECLPQCMKII